MKSPPTHLASSVLERMKIPTTQSPLPNYRNTKISKCPTRDTNIPKLKNFKIPKYQLIQNIKIRRPIWRRACWTCSNWPLPAYQIPNYRKHLKISNIRLSKIPLTKVSNYRKCQHIRLINLQPHPFPYSFCFFLFPRGLGHQLSHGHDEPGPQPKGQRLNGHKLGTRAIAWGLGPWPWLRAMPGPWPRHKPNRQRPKAKGHKLGAMAQDIQVPRVRVGKPAGRGRPLNPRLRGKYSK